MTSVQAKIDSAALPSGRTAIETEDIRQLVSLIHKNRRKVLSGRSIDALYTFGLDIAKRKHHAMIAMDRADMAHLLKGLGWRVRPGKVKTGTGRWIPPKPYAQKQQGVHRRHRGRSRW